MLRGLKFRILLAAAVVVVVAIIAGVLAFVLGGDFSGFGEAVWWAFLRLTDPGYLGDDEGIAKRSISTIVTVLGYVLFLGLLIAILTQWLNQTIEKLESGVTPVVLSEHVIVLGWTHQTRPIVEALLQTGPRVKRFLARRRVRDLHVVIMVEEVDEALRQRVSERFGQQKAGRRVLLRAGTPLRVDHLERVAYRDAAVIILPGAGFAERYPERVDALTVKTLASVSTSAGQTGETPPFAVAEIFDVRNVSLATHVYKGECEVIAADGLVSRLIAQSVRHRGLWSVLSELFMLNEGHSIYLREIDGQAGARFGSLQGCFRRAIVLGFIRPGESRPALNPDPDSVLEAGDLLVFLAREFDDCMPASGEPSTPLSARTEQIPHPPKLVTRRVLVLGWSRKAPALLRELGRFGKDAFEVDVVSSMPVKAREEDLAQYVSSGTLPRVRHIEAGFSSPGSIEGLKPERYHNIISLASEMLGEKEHADAISVATALRLRGLLSERDPRPDVMVELLDRENLNLFHGGDEDVLVSSTVVSYVVSQVALRRELARIFWELTRPWGGQVLMRPAETYLETSGPVQFCAIQRKAAGYGEIALGFRRPSEREHGPTLNPDRNSEWCIESGDEVIVLTSIEQHGE